METPPPTAQPRQVHQNSAGDVSLDTAVQIADLVRIARAVRATQALQQELIDAVRAARQQGRSWTEISVALGVTRQAARQRFNPPT